MRHLLYVLLLCGFSFTAPGALMGNKTQARLLLSAETARAGETVMAGIELRMPPGWHTYWRNSGESGQPTQVQWELPPGVTAGEILWPPPERFLETDFTTYIYHDQAVLLVPLKLANDVARGKLDFQAKVSWLECEKACVPGSAKVKASLTVGDTSKPSDDAKLIEDWKGKLPTTDPSLAVRAFWDGNPTEDTRALIIEWVTTETVTAPDFYPYASDTYEILPVTDNIPTDPGKIWLRKKVKKAEGVWPTQIQGLLIGNPKGPRPSLAHEIKVPIEGPKEPAGAAASTTPIASKAKKSLAKMLGFAFLGGLILNIMPCVLPVIALKILGFVNQSREAPQEVRKLGLIYALGVLFSFLILAGLIIGVQKAGYIASWGMQFSNPQFLIVMTILITLVALNLFGVFEVNLGGAAMGAAGNLAAKEGNAGAFFNGVLATTLATPCTAPFLAPALGFAFAQPPGIIVLVFLAIGVGLAAPYVVLSWQPSWLKYLPKPGAWMEKFKVGMGFPMLATAVWLLTLSTRRLGEDGVLWMGLFLVGLGVAAWIWGEFVQRGRRQKGLSIAACLAVLVFSYAYILEGQLNWRAPARTVSSASGKQNNPNGIQWQPWSPEAVQKARSEARPVFVDFTADWCLTCKANKKFSIEIPSVQAKLKEINAVPLLGDNTDSPPEVVAELKRFDRAGVPLVLVYPKDPKAEPIVLPEVLTPKIVLDALDQAGK
ncbi:MAG: protein-disulfide reductase DsbD domain-containing protein [Verrucomicrobiota bacterium]